MRRKTGKFGDEEVSGRKNIMKKTITKREERKKSGGGGEGGGNKTLQTRGKGRGRRKQGEENIRQGKKSKQT